MAIPKKALGFLVLTTCIVLYLALVFFPKHFETRSNAVISTPLVKNNNVFKTASTYKQDQWLSNMYSEEPSLKQEVYKKACVQPVLDPFKGDNYIKYFVKETPVVCTNDTDWIEIDNGTLFISEEASRRHTNISCTIRYILRQGDDNRWKFGSTISVKPRKRYLLKDDFFKADCISGNATYSNFHAGISYRPKIQSRVSDTSEGLGFNVIMLGFDSVSHMTFLRKLPKAHKYFSEEMKGITLNGYNGVGDGTGENLTPILTGKTESQLPSALKGRSGSSYVNVWPFIWQDLQKKGFVTAFASDSTYYGTYTYRLKGFKTQPTDHYMRTFYLAAKRAYGNYNRLCLGSKRRHTVLFDYILDFYQMYKTKSKFIFGFHAELSHSNLNLLGVADDDLLQLLKDLKDGGHLQNTVVMLMSDHGYRYGPARETDQGKLEERLPFFGIAIPKDMAAKYPVVLKNLKQNANCLTTPFDINPTLREAIQFSGGGPGTLKQRGISLFQEIPLTRTCKHAGIDEHYCTCIQWKNIHKQDKKIQIISNILLNHINLITEKFRNICAKFEVGEVISAATYDPTPTSAKIKHRGILFSTTEIFQIRIKVAPAPAHFEATLKWNSKLKTFDVTEAVSRTDIYGNTTQCIYEKDPDLMKFCHCTK